MSDAPPPLAEVTALLLAGGLGTRLKAVVPDQQKVVAAVGQRPFVTRLLDQLAAAGLRRAVLCIGHHGEQVRQLLGDRHGPLDLLYSPEPHPLGTAGAARLALPLLSGSTALVLNGDSYCAADLNAFWRWHTQRSAPASLILTSVADVARYGQVQCDPEGRVTRFVEKGAGSGPGWISAGLYLLHRAVLESIPPGRPISIEQEVFPAWVGRGLSGWPGGGRFIDIGTPESFAASQDFFPE